MAGSAGKEAKETVAKGIEVVVNTAEYSTTSGSGKRHGDDRLEVPV